MAGPEITLDCDVAFSASTRISPRFALSGDGGRATVLFGPSGCGKTTCLRLLAGLQRPSSGRILADGVVWNDAAPGIHLPTQKRKIGFLFQSYALFPHLTVRGNLAFGIRHLAKDVQSRRIGELAEMLRIGELMAQYPPTLSGGQSQRVALGRSLATQPGWLFLDEPLSALDESLRAEIGFDLRQLLMEQGIPHVIVTHDRRELEVLGDALVLLEKGLVLQKGPVREVLRHPVSLQAASVLGFENILPIDHPEGDRSCMSAEWQGVRLRGIAPQANPSPTHAAIRAESIRPLADREPLPEDSNILQGKLLAITTAGPLLRLRFEAPGLIDVVISAQFAKQLSLIEGRLLRLAVPFSEVCLVG